MKRTNATDRQRILAAIDAIPLDLLPDDTARLVLRLLANDGVVDLAVYQHGGGDWVIWLRPAERWQDGRSTLAEWQRDYATLALAAYTLAEQRGKVGAA